jgi:AcrR family transcriptional regulator
MEQGLESSKLSREAWMDAAFAVLTEGGVDAVRVQLLARSLGVTRGSFYWHFRDVNDLLRALLDRWFDKETTAVVTAVEAEGGTASARLLRLLKICASDDGKVELAMRSWARSDDLAKDALRRVDKARTEYLCELIRHIGHAQKAAEELASIVYLAWLGLYSSYTFPNRDSRVSQMVKLHSFLAQQDLLEENR